MTEPTKINFAENSILDVASKEEEDVVKVEDIFAFMLKPPDGIKITG